MKTELIELKIKHEDLFLYFKYLNNIINFDINITSKNNFKFLNIINNLSHKELKLIKQYIPYNFYIIMSLYYYKLTPLVFLTFCNELQWKIILNNHIKPKFWDLLYLCIKDLSIKNLNIIKEYIKYSKINILKKDIPNWFLPYLNDEIKKIN